MWGLKAGGCGSAVVGEKLAGARLSGSTWELPSACYQEDQGGKKASSRVLLSG